MGRRIAAITFIFIFSAIAWFVLGTSVVIRSGAADGKLRRAVGQLWGEPQMQNAPTVSYVAGRREAKQGTHFIPLDASDLAVDLKLDYRRKGLLWYSTYRVLFSGKYRVRNTTDRRREIAFRYRFPARDGVYDNFRVSVGGRELADLEVAKGAVTARLDLRRGETREVEVRYGSQGLLQWWYVFGDEVSRVENFRLVMTTDFDRIDFPENGISPTAKERAAAGWRMTWEYASLFSGVQIGMELPQRMNPGPFVSRVSFFAPVSLFFFFFLLLIITARRGIDLHPMNYFFLAAAFFSFHLLMAYLVDHVSIHASLAASSAVSIVLVVSYMRLVAGARFAFLSTGVAQFVYLVLFSYAFLLEGFTGLAITVCSIVTLFVVMQMTGRTDWGEKFRAGA